MTDLDAALEPLRELLARRAAERKNGSGESESIDRLVAAAAALQKPATVPERPAGADWELYERNRAEIREIVKRLRNGSH